MTDLDKIVIKVDQGSGRYSRHSFVSSVSVKTKPASVKTKLPRFKLSEIEGTVIVTEIQDKTWNTADAIRRVQKTPPLAQSAITARNCFPIT